MLVVLKVINLRCLRKLVSVVTLFRSGSGLRCHKVISPLRPSWPPGFGGSEKIKKKKFAGRVTRNQTSVPGTPASVKLSQVCGPHLRQILSPTEPMPRVMRRPLSAIFSLSSQLSKDRTIPSVFHLQKIRSIPYWCYTGLFPSMTRPMKTMLYPPCRSI